MQLTVHLIRTKVRDSAEEDKGDYNLLSENASSTFSALSYITRSNALLTVLWPTLLKRQPPRRKIPAAAAVQNLSVDDIQ